MALARTCAIGSTLDKLVAELSGLLLNYRVLSIDRYIMPSSPSNPSSVAQISVQDLANRIAENGNPIQLIDVREPEELAIARLEGFANLPLSQFPEWSNEIQTRFDPQVETIVLCHHGVRSGQMCHWLLNQGFTHVKNVVGGIEAYALRVDSNIPRY